MFLLMSNIQNQNTKVSEELGFEVRVDAPYDEAIDAVTEALEAEGFGVLTRIDVDRAPMTGGQEKALSWSCHCHK